MSNERDPIQIEIVKVEPAGRKLRIIDPTKCVGELGLFLFRKVSDDGMVIVKVCVVGDDIKNESLVFIDGWVLPPNVAGAFSDSIEHLIRATYTQTEPDTYKIKNVLELLEVIDRAYNRFNKWRIHPRVIAAHQKCKEVFDEIRSIKQAVSAYDVSYLERMSCAHALEELRTADKTVELLITNATKLINLRSKSNDAEDDMWDAYKLFEETIGVMAKKIIKAAK